jgi:transcriptional regulator with XRE-family HTH domain
VGRSRSTTDAVKILHRRYIKDDPVRMAALDAERTNAQIARMIYDLRTDAGLSQRELAELVGTTQSVISRLEDSDYAGHSLSMLNRIAKALNQRVTVAITSADSETDTLRHAFHVVVQNLRRAKGLTAAELSKQTGIPRREIIAFLRLLKKGA